MRSALMATEPRPAATTEVAAGGEILVSADASAVAGLQPDLETRHLTVRGRQRSLDVRVLQL